MSKNVNSVQEERAIKETQIFRYTTPINFSQNVNELDNILNEKLNNRNIITSFQCATSEQRTSMEKPNDYRLWIRKGLALEEQLLFVDAIDTYSEGIAINPFNDILYECRGHIYITVGRYKEAIADSTLCVRLNPLNWYGWYHIGLGNYFLGEFKKAIIAFKKCLEFSYAENMHNSAAIDWMYLSYKHMGMDKEAKETLELVDDNVPKDLEDLYKIRVLIYKGIINPKEQLDNIPKNDNYYFMYSSIGFGVAMNYYFKGNKSLSKALMTEIIDNEKNWNTFGYLASLREINRLFNINM